MKKLKVNNIVFIGILLIYCMYASLFIYRTSFIVDGERYFSLFDDAMVSMRYAKHFADGSGLVWNPGERVEGYTNPLWVIFMALFHLFPIASSKMSLLVQVSGALFLIANLFFVKKLAESLSDNSTLVAALAVVMTAFYLSLNYWSLLGMEVSAVTLLITASVWKTVQSIKLKEFSLLPYLLLGIGMFIRPDMLVPFLAILSFALVMDPSHRKSHLLYGLIILAVVVSTQTAFRLIYYGDALPNTYYLKMTGYPLLLRISRGLYVFFQFVWKLNWILFLIPFFILFFRREREVLLLSWIFLLQALYSIYVGGDAWEHWGGANRFLSIVMPLFFILFCYSLVTIVNKITESSGLFANRANYAIIVVAFFSLLNFNAIYGTSALKEWLLIERPFYVPQNQKNVKLAFILSNITDSHARIAVIWGGAIPYFCDRYAIDILGKSDKRIARGKAKVSSGRSRFTGFLPGHTKWNYDYSIGQLKPDIVVGLVPGDIEGAKPYLESRYTRVMLGGVNLFFSKGAHNIRWDKINWALDTFD